ncbi:MAG: hypothetical protein SFT93_02065 [Rickettsiaceae bacterium]|nr:hypothetical protein [Rickettsiaceae bacterium]
MRNFTVLIFMCIIIYIIYTEDNDGSKTIIHEVKNKVQELNRPKREHIGDKANNNGSSLIEKNNKTQKTGNQSFVERVLSDSLTSYMQTDSGQKFLKSSLSIEGINSQKYSISTNRASIIRSSFRMNLIKASSEEKCICGQRVILKFAESDKQENFEQLEYKIGEKKQEILKDILNYLPKDEVIVVYAPDKFALAENLAPKSDKYKLYISDTLDSHGLETNKIKIFDDFITNLNYVKCGDKIAFSFKIMEIDGTIISDSMMNYEVGDFSYPPVLSYITSYMNFVGTRTIILPKRYLQTSSKPLISSSNDKNYVIMEITNVILNPRNF